jgi:hypothetical protein
MQLIVNWKVRGSEAKSCGDQTTFKPWGGQPALGGWDDIRFDYIITALLHEPEPFLGTAQADASLWALIP